ncbi:hypothetical protein HmCmsJML240_01306 [Escherichia coli]|nr:hypothetical protein A13Y_00069 [Escherichia coli KTE194]EQV28782.1 hypothetical protein G881_04411 [Escherichia coli KOEGE 30 (63a)]EQW14185.1 hypothetical protein G898_03838 [Escherichia coli UMEA 3014-1]EQX15747.1 hypothetical protein G923_03907 [Escherichia coli UMEA 3160-1]EQX72883.1 hypothetical protein G936_03932 [Escherichia coli UMEA 3193-1]ERA29949.1 hypothetical protein H002_04465 [Escherichia coli UMEA 4075-1]GDC50489.1 hypothetical protein HmCmsJML240_01306 [Escherichia coli]
MTPAILSARNISKTLVTALCWRCFGYKALIVRGGEYSGNICTKEPCCSASSTIKSGKRTIPPLFSSLTDHFPVIAAKLHAYSVSFLRLTSSHTAFSGHTEGSYVVSVQILSGAYLANGDKLGWHKSPLSVYPDNGRLRLSSSGYQYAKPYRNLPLSAPVI